MKFSRKLTLLSTIIPFLFLSCEDDLVPGQSVPPPIPGVDEEIDQTDPDRDNLDQGDIIIPREANIDPALRPAVQTFVDEANSREVALDLSNLSVIFADTGESLGTCELFSNGDKVVSINNNFITEGDPSYTVIHELGHCILRMEHRDEQLSIMNRFENDNALRQADQTELFDEFFNPLFFNAL